MLIFGKGFHPWTHKGKLITHEAAVKVLEKQQGQLPKTVLLRVWLESTFFLKLISDFLILRKLECPLRVVSMRMEDHF